MTATQQKNLVIAAAGVGGVLLILLLVNAVVLSPARELDAQALKYEDDIRKANRALLNEANVARRLAELYRSTFGSDETDVAERMRARLMDLLAPSGLNTEKVSSSATPVEAFGKGRDRVLSRNINISAAQLAHAIDLLYLLDEDSHLHRFDTLTVTPSADPGKVDLSFKYSTLTMELPKGAKATTSPAAIPIASLDTGDRSLYHVIEERDIFRKYVKRPPPPPEPSRTPEPVRTPEPTPPPRPGEPEEAKWRVAGLPTMFGTEMVHVRHRNGELRTYKLGQTLMDGKIVMIDYRAMPRFDNPKAISESRVILQMKDTYWAVELGDVLTQKHRLGAAELPEPLKTPSTAPAQTVTRGDSN